MCNGHAMPDKHPPLIGTAEAAEILGIDRSTLSRHVAFGKIQPAMQLPGIRGAMLFDRQGVEQYAKELRKASA